MRQHPAGVAIKVYLASASPRRRQLLDQVGVAYTVIKPDVDESWHNDANPENYTQRIAGTKAAFARAKIISGKLDLLPIVAADTAVVINDQILGKPDNAEQAREMLMRLSGNTHQVYSSICVTQDSYLETTTQISQVTFRKISEAEITAYWKCGEPTDKAGSYAIQGQAAKFISHLSGSYSGVMGLPLYELMQILTKT